MTKHALILLQQWNVPKNSDAQGPIPFTQLKFEKANYDRDNKNKRKRPILSASRDGYCATPPSQEKLTLKG